MTPLTITPLTLTIAATQPSASELTHSDDRFPARKQLTAHWVQGDDGKLACQWVMEAVATVKHP